MSFKKHSRIDWNHQQLNLKQSKLEQRIFKEQRKKKTIEQKTFPDNEEKKLDYPPHIDFCDNIFFHIIKIIKIICKCYIQK